MSTVTLDPDAIQEIQELHGSDLPVTVADLLPWDVAEEHQDCRVMENIRTILKHRNDQPTTDAEEQRLHDWLEGLCELGVVIAYDRDAPANVASVRGGFYFVERRREDAWIIRDPALGGPELKVE